MSEKYVLALDSGTIKNRAVIFNSKGEMVSYAEKKRPHHLGNNERGKRKVLLMKNILLIIVILTYL